MKNLIRDIQEFLKKEFNFIWNKDIIDNNTDKVRKARLEDFVTNFTNRFVVSSTDNDIFEIYVRANDSDFVVDGKDYSHEWIGFKIDAFSVIM